MHSPLPSFEKCVQAIADTLIRQELPSRETPEIAEAIGIYVLAAHAGMPDYLRLAFRILTLVFDAWSFPVAGKPFHQLSPDRRADQLRHWQFSRLKIRPALISFYRTLTFFGLYSELYKQDVECGSHREHN
ncbi:MULTISPECIES: hypothetical protein [Mesorhizobium]|uniref:Uncharacterized protein n=1 Tax=Rhizobium loti TaxID=381 RepID=A0A8E3B527_RHILI|nr:MULTISPECIES: hypothetical protein [Mesorhizobium]PWJ91314.1 hypothetical protein C8D77_1038 [Mesorhizobium loti]RUX97970.1 hypothetical protein EN993_01830 [Mesorhizobium sp. M7D.F.Ca.US.004.01.2.1]